MAGVLRVVAGILEAEGRVLLTRRRAGTHLAGLWEFPGGKVEAGESDPVALARELREEIGVRVRVGELFEQVTHAYPDRTVALRFYRCEILEGTPEALEVADLAWVPVSELSGYPLPPADAPLVGRLLEAAGIMSTS